MTQTGEASCVFSPQRLKPGGCEAVYGTAKAVPFHGASPFTTPQSLAPVDSRGGYPMSRVLARSGAVDGSSVKAGPSTWHHVSQWKHDASLGMTVFENVLRHG